MKVDKSKVIFHNDKYNTWCHYSIDEHHVVQTIAKCSKNDEWNEDTGRREAMKRMREFCKRIDPQKEETMTKTAMHQYTDATGTLIITDNVVKACDNCIHASVWIDKAPCATCYGFSNWGEKESGIVYIEQDHKLWQTDEGLVKDTDGKSIEPGALCAFSDENHNVNVTRLFDRYGTDNRYYDNLGFSWAYCWKVTNKSKDEQ